MQPQEAPRVAVVIPNFNGRKYLAECLESLVSQGYPPQSLEIVVVDNGSDDGSDIIADRFESVTVLRLGENVGFAAAANRGASATDAELIAFLNNDMVVERGWLQHLVEAVSGVNGHDCAGSWILDRSGRRVDFVHGRLNFQGMADQPRFGDAIEAVDAGPIEPALFTCGGAMIIRRPVFEEIGGFDAEYFAYFEDVDLGWRLNLSGYSVVMVRSSRVRHHHHGTSRRMSSAQRQILLERNALRTVIKNAEGSAAFTWLSGALLLGAVRAVDVAAIPRRRMIPFARSYGTVRVPEVALAPLVAAADIAAEIDTLQRKRQVIQARRRIEDRVLAKRFGGFGALIGATSIEYHEVFAKVAGALKIEATSTLDAYVQPRRTPRWLYLLRMAAPLDRLVRRRR